MQRRSAPTFCSGRVPAVYQTALFLWFFSVLLFRRANKLRDISPHWEFDSHPVRSRESAINELRQKMTPDHCF